MSEYEIDDDSKWEFYHISTSSYDPDLESDKFSIDEFKNVMQLKLQMDKLAAFT